MHHKSRWTLLKIAQRLTLIEPFVYRRHQSLPPLRYQALSGPLEAPPVQPEVDDSTWTLIQRHSYWGQWLTDFVLRTHFQVPEDWDPSAPIALYLPLGSAWRTHLLDENQGALTPVGSTLRLFVQLYEVVTVRLVLA